MKKQEKLPSDVGISTAPVPNSKKIFVKGKLHNIKVTKLFGKIRIKF